MSYDDLMAEDTEETAVKPAGLIGAVALILLGVAAVWIGWDTISGGKKKGCGCGGSGD